MTFSANTETVRRRIQVGFRRARVANDCRKHPQCWDIIDTSGYCIL